MSTIAAGNTLDAPVRSLSIAARQLKISPNSALKLSSQPQESGSMANPSVDNNSEEIVNIIQQWHSRIDRECPALSTATKSCTIRWLLGADLDRSHRFSAAQMAIVTQGWEYRYQVLCQRYLGVPPTKAYKNLMQRLGGLAVLRHKIRAWIATSRDRQRTVVDVLQEVVQEMTERDKYIQQQIEWIAQCTKNPQLRNSLLLATIEEYCSRSIRNQPLIAYRFVNYLRRSQSGGMTYLPPDNFVKMVSAEATAEGEEEPTVNLIDYMLMEDKLEQHDWEETQILRAEVQQRLSIYLTEKLGTHASEWLRLYLLGKNPEEIAVALQLDLKDVYRLREKVAYHAKALAIKNQTEIVGEWLKISLSEHNLGLTNSQWTDFDRQLTPKQRYILTSLKTGEAIATIAKDLRLKTNQVEGEWKQIYLLAQNIRNGEIAFRSID